MYVLQISVGPPEMRTMRQDVAVVLAPPVIHSMPDQRRGVLRSRSEYENFAVCFD